MANAKRNKNDVASFLGELISFRSSLKLIHWSITGKGSYEAHISLDQAIDSLVDITDRLVETTFALEGTLNIIIPKLPDPKIISGILKLFINRLKTHANNCFQNRFLNPSLMMHRKLFNNCCSA